MRILGLDGDCGWPATLCISFRRHKIAIADTFCRRLSDKELGVQTRTPIQPPPENVEHGSV
jgi:UDP-sulfoquinovose synthase